MKNPLERLRSDLQNPRNSQGMRQACVVDYKALVELLDGYERFDSDARSAQDIYAPLERRLHDAITAMYHNQRKNGERTLTIIMQTLADLMTENQNRQERLAYRSTY